VAPGVTERATANAMRAAPGLDEFITEYAPEWRGNRSVKRLHEILVALDPSATMEARAQSLEVLAKWVGDRGRVPPKGATNEALPQMPRLRLLLRVLREVPRFRTDLSRVVASVLSETSGLHLFARMGLPSDRGLFGETIDRLSRRLLPAPVDDNDLGQLLSRMFPRKRDPGWLAAIDEQTLHELALTLSESDRETFGPVRTAAADALALLATRVSALGLSEEIRARSPKRPFLERPFFQIRGIFDALVSTLHVAEVGVRAERAARCSASIAACRAIVLAVHDALETRGVSVDVVYRLELITKSLDRMEILVEQLKRDPGTPLDCSPVKLLARLAEDRLRDRNLAELVRTNMRLLARKIIERAGTSGEHYITTSRAEYRVMLLSAAGGGVLTALTAAIKFFILAGKYAPFVEGALASINYAGSFLVMQMLGMTLATKQPSMTAAALAGALRDSDQRHELGDLVTIIARITRSQFAAAVGNIALVVAGGFAIDFAWQRTYGRHFLDEHTAEHVLRSLQLDGGMVPFGALTGVALWASSVGAGWLENWAVYRRLPEAIAEHRASRILGKRITAWVSRIFARNISGVGGNVTLGAILGMTPNLGRFFGLPLEVPHVTLSSGALTIACCALGSHGMREHGFGWAVLGIAIIGVCNFGVSFILALSVAVRAREVQTNTFRIFLAVAMQFFRTPARFFFPPSDDEAPQPSRESAAL